MSVPAVQSDVEMRQFASPNVTRNPDTGFMPSGQKIKVKPNDHHSHHVHQTASPIIEEKSCCSSCCSNCGDCCCCCYQGCCSCCGLCMEGWCNCCGKCMKGCYKVCCSGPFAISWGVLLLHTIACIPCGIYLICKGCKEID